MKNENEVEIGVYLKARTEAEAIEKAKNYLNWWPNFVIEDISVLKDNLETDTWEIWIGIRR